MSLKFWDSVEKTNPDYTKNIEVSRQNRTTVHAQYKKKMITKAFGMYGLGWGVVAESEKYERIHYENSTCILNYTAIAFYKHDGETAKFPIAAQIKEAYVTSGGKGYLKVDDEAVKKVRTDALTKGFTDLGFCADIHMGYFDDQDYIYGAKIAADIERQDKNEEKQNKAYNDIKNWILENVESARTIKNDESFVKAIDRVTEKVIMRCQAAGFSSKGFETKLKETRGERNASK